MLLLGDPGAGKTTGARLLCWQLASGEVPADELGLPAGAIPVFLRLRNLRPEHLAGGLEGSDGVMAGQTGSGLDLKLSSRGSPSGLSLVLSQGLTPFVLSFTEK